MVTGVVDRLCLVVPGLCTMYTETVVTGVVDRLCLVVHGLSTVYRDCGDWSG